VGLMTARLIEVVEEPLAGARNVVHVVAGWSEGAVRIDGREVVEARFFAMDDLPDLLATALPDGLPRWLGSLDAPDRARRAGQGGEVRGEIVGS